MKAARARSPARLPGRCLALAAVLSSAPAAGGEAASPGWLAAVGTLQVPAHRFETGRRRHYLEDCSATLVTAGTRGSANTIITAWHCLEHYGDLSRPITFSLPRRDAPPVTREAYRLADGGGMHADWAILRLREGIPAGLAAPLTIHPALADPGLDISMAGYARDHGARGRSLRVDPDCRILPRRRAATATDCSAGKGSSGGAVVQRSAGGRMLFCGVISEGDGAGYSGFVPVESFRSAIERHLR